MTKRKIDFVRDINGEMCFQHCTDEIFSNPGTFREPVLAGLSRSRDEGFSMTAQSNGTCYEYVVSRKSETRSNDVIRRKTLLIIMYKRMIFKLFHYQTILYPL